jgi:hypothetical protein
MGGNPPLPGHIIYPPRGAASRFAIPIVRERFFSVNPGGAFFVKFGRNRDGHRIALVRVRGSEE